MRLVEDVLDVIRTYAELGAVSSCDRVDSSIPQRPLTTPSTTLLHLKSMSERTSGEAIHARY